MALNKIDSNIDENSHIGLISLCCLMLTLITACQSASINTKEATTLLHDERYPDYSKVTIETEQEVFEIDQSVKQFIDIKLSRSVTSADKIEDLADAIFNYSNLNLLYKSEANTTANETFKNRTANCLSLTIMTYAMADYAKLGVRFQQIKTPELWLRKNGNSLLNKHVNLRLYHKPNNNTTISFSEKSYQLDFDRRTQSLRLPAKEISKRRVLAMFYNNKGAYALIDNAYSEAYAYFRAALLTDDLLLEAWTNLGILYHRGENDVYAEASYQQALAINQSDLTALENLAHLYRDTNRVSQADKIELGILNRRKLNPYYHFMLGDIEYENKQWKLAIKHYQKALRLNKRPVEFYASIAKSYHQIGDVVNTQRYLKLAKKYSPDSDSQNRYQSKIDTLSRYDKPQ